MLIIIVVLLIVYIAIWYFDSKWSTEEHQKEAAEKLADSTREVYAKSRDWLGQLRLPFQSEARAEIVPFKQWLSQVNLTKSSSFYKQLPADTRDFVTWVELLPDEVLTELVTDLAIICQMQGFDLAWLVDPQTPEHLKQALEETVVLHCLAAWKARDILPFKTYKAWQAAPNKAENRLFAQKLYSKLVEVGQTTLPTDLMLATDWQRQAHVNKVIDNAAAENPTMFLTLVQDVMSELENEKVVGKSARTSAPLPA